MATPGRASGYRREIASMCDVVREAMRAGGGHVVVAGADALDGDDRPVPSRPGHMTSCWPSPRHR
jgi:hypothetical protein